MKRLLSGFFAVIFTVLCFTGCTTPASENVPGDREPDVTEVESSEGAGGGSSTKPAGSGSKQ